MGKQEATTLQKMHPEEIEDDNDDVLDVGYFVKIWPKDLNAISKFERAEKLIQEMNKLVPQIKQRIMETKLAQYKLTSTLECPKWHHQALTQNMAMKREEINNLNLALQKLFDPRYAYRETQAKSSSTDELENHKLKHRMVHSAKSLAEEKQLLRQLDKSQQKRSDDSFSPLRELNNYNMRRTSLHKLVDEIEKVQMARPDAVCNAGPKGKHGNFLGLKKDIKSQVKLLDQKIMEEKREQLSLINETKPIKRELQRIDKSITSLRKKLLDSRQRKNEAYLCILKLRSEYETENGQYFQYRALLKRVKENAETKDVPALCEMSYTEVERFLLQWNYSKEIRVDYVNTILPSLEQRQLSVDGRMRSNLV